MKNSSIGVVILASAIAIAPLHAGTQDVASRPTRVVLERTECADTFSARVLAARAAYERHLNSTPEGTPFTGTTAADAACESDDAAHRISLVLRPEDPYAAIIAQELMCYANAARPQCASAMEHVLNARRRQRDLRRAAPAQ